MRCLAWSSATPIRSHGKFVSRGVRRVSCSVESPAASETLRISRRRLLRLAGAAGIVTLIPNPSSAVCGEPDPDWAHYLSWKEDQVDVNGRKVHYRVVGKLRTERKAGVLPVLCLDDAGIAMEAMDSLDLLAQSQRRIIRIDALGSGYSSPLDTISERMTPEEALDIAVREAEAVLKTNGIRTQKDRFHIFCAGSGAQVAARLLETEPSTNRWQIASVAVEPTTLSVAKNLPICAAEGVLRANARVVEAHRTASDSKTYDRAIGLLTSAGIPVMFLSAKGKLAPRATGVKEVSIDGPIGTPHLDDLMSTLDALDMFYLETEKALGLTSTS